MRHAERSKAKKGELILVVSVGLSAFLVLISAAIGSIALIVNTLMLSIMIIILPYSLYKFFRFKKIRSYETEFPNFLRDVSESVRADLSLIQSIHSAAKSDYGLLTQEIQKMSNQLSWNVPFEKVLRNFSDRVADSKIITRSLLIIDQSNKSGGNIEDTMEALASNIESIKDTQEEKSVLLNQQVMMMYAIFFIFLGITIALIKFLLPMLDSGINTGGISGANFNTNPCAVCRSSSDPACFGCYAFDGIAVGFDLGKVGESAAYYKSLFFTMILIQGFFSGLIAGQIGSDSMSMGIKHSMIMVLSGFIIFIVMAKIGFI